MTEGTKNSNQKDSSALDNFLLKIIRGRLHKLAAGHVTAHLIDSHQKKNNPKKINEEAPTNVMGNSATTESPIAGFDPILRVKRILRRKKPIT